MAIVRQQTLDISGFGNGYEDTCQEMLWRGVAYLAERKPPVFMWQNSRQSPQIVGILITEGEELKALEKYITSGPRGTGCSGAQHQAVMNHLAYIHNHGTEEWLAEAAKHRDAADFYEWEGEIDAVAAEAKGDG